MEEQDILDELASRITAAIDAFKREANRLRTGRANSSMLDSVRVEYYGSEMALTQVANVTVVDPRLLQVKPWERTMCGPIEKAILAANLGLTPSNRGESILVPIPAMTGERRRELSKVVKQLAEDAKVSVRNGRRDANELLDMVENMPEDDLARAKKKVQEAVDAAGKRIDQITAEKEAEILEG